MTFRAALALLRPHGAALAALALFLAASLAALDDYGLTSDEEWQRVTAARAISFALPVELEFAAPIPTLPHDQFYGVAFEAPLLLAEPALGLGSGREIFLARHLAIRLFFLAGGLFAYLLARRLFGGGVLPVAAMLLFLLAPRLHAHSFFNSKDIPFLVTFMAALFLARGAFRRETLWSFALLGVGVGILTNLRIMGVVLFAVIPAARALDLIFASGWAERKRAALTLCALALSGALTVYATMPHLWADPIGRAIEWWTTLSNHPLVLWQLLGGEPVVTSRLPVRYLPVWFSITNVPAVLLLGGVGALAAGAAGALHFRKALRNTRLRFLLLILACFATPVLAVIVLQPNVYNGWRHLYFLWAPFSLLAAFGLYALASAFRQKRQRAAVYGAAGAAACAAAVSMILIHPHQQVYFNFFVDRTTPERLRAQYDLDHLAIPGVEALRTLLRAHPDGTIPVQGILRRNAQLLTEPERRRILGTDEFEAFYFGDSLGEWSLGRAVGPSHVPLTAQERLYGSTLYWAARFAVDGAAAEPYRATYDALSSAEPAVRSVFNVYWDGPLHNLPSFPRRRESRPADRREAPYPPLIRDGNSLIYAKDDCVPQDVEQYVFLHVYPKTLDGAPKAIRAHGFHNLFFAFRQRGAAFDGKCLAVVPLPDYPIARIATGQTGANPWREEFAPPGDSSPP